MRILQTLSRRRVPFKTARRRRLRRGILLAGTIDAGTRALMEALYRAALAHQAVRPRIAPVRNFVFVNHTDTLERGARYG